MIFGIYALVGLLGLHGDMRSGFRHATPIMEDQMENDMKARVMKRYRMEWFGSGV